MKNTSQEKPVSIPIEVTPIDIHAIIQFCFAESNGDAVTAARLLQRRALADRELFTAITEPVLPGACWDLIRRYCMSEKRTITTMMSQEKMGQERIEQLAKANIHSLFDFLLKINNLIHL